MMAFIQVYNNDIGVLLGYIRDLTLQGVQVISEKCLDVDTLITLALALPGGLPEVTATRMTISASVVHCGKDESSQTYKIGLAFTGIKSEQTGTIHALLERHHFHQ